MNQFKAIALLLFIGISSIPVNAQEPVKGQKGQVDPSAEMAQPPPSPTVVEEIFTVAESMPYLDECKGLKARSDQKSCNQETMLRKIYQHLEYPAVAFENGVEGLVFMTYIVDKDGSISGIKVTRDIGAGCGAAAEEALLAVSQTTKYRPGMQRNQVVKVRMGISVEFFKSSFNIDRTYKKGNLEEDLYEEEEIFRVVEQMPRFPGCEDGNMTKQERQECSRNLLLQYIYRNLSYPEEARKKGVEGRVIIRFVVAKDGSLEDIELLRDIGGGCGEAALNVVEKMNMESIRWEPGIQRGKPVKVAYNLPVSFKL